MFEQIPYSQQFDYDSNGYNPGSSATFLKPILVSMFFGLYDTWDGAQCT